MTNRKIQLTTVVDGQTVDVFPNTKSEFVEFADGKTLEDKINKLGDAHGHSNATPDKDGFMSKEDKAKLDNVTNYTHPSTHAATMITEDATHRFVTDAEKTKWNNKADTTMASKTNAGLMSASDKQRIDGLNADFKTRDDKINKNTEDIKSWNDEMINKDYQYFNGENITINNSIVSKTTDMIIKGKTFQNIIKMKDYIQVEGVTRKEGNNFVINKTMPTAKAMSLHKDKVPLLKPNTTYTVMANITNNNMTKFFNLIHCYQTIMLTKNDVRVEARQNGSICKTFTTIDNLNDGSRFEIIFPDDCTGSVEIRNMMIFEGDLTSIFIDEYFEGIRSFGEIENKIKLKSSSKNIFKGEKDSYVATPNKLIQVYDNVKDLIGIKTDGVTFKAKISMSKDFVNDNHFGFDIQFLFSDGTSTWSNFTKGNGLAGINPGDTDRYFSWFCNFGSVKTISSLQQCFIFTRTSVGTLTFSEIQVIPYKDINNEEYEKACIDEKEIILPSNFTNGLMELSNTVYDEANNISKKFTKRISKMEFNGNENNGYSIEDKGDNWKFGIRIPDAKPESTVGICNTFANVSSNMDEKTTQGFRLYTHNPSNIELRFAINKRILNTGGSLPTNNDIKNFFKNNPTVVFYELNNPIEIDFKEDLNLKTFNKITYIKTDDFIKANINFTVAMNTAANLDINSLRLNDVENFVKENKDNNNKISKLETAQLSTALNVLELQKHTSMLDNGEIDEYKDHVGNFIRCDNTLNSRTENMIIKGQTLHNIQKKQNYSFPTNLDSSSYTVNLNNNSCEVTIKNYESGKYYYISGGLVNFSLLKPNTVYSIIANATDGLNPCIRTPSFLYPLNKTSTPFMNGVATITTNDLSAGYKEQVLYVNMRTDMLNRVQYLKNAMILEGDWTNKRIPFNYFEGIKSTGEAEYNILNENQISIGYIGGDGGNKYVIPSYDDGTRTAIIPCESNMTYTITKEFITDRFLVATSSQKPTSNMQVEKIIQDNTAKSITITTSSNAKYLLVYLTMNCNNASYGKVNINKSCISVKWSVPGKYNVSLLSHGKNIFNFKTYKKEIENINGITFQKNGFKIDSAINGSIGNKILSKTQILKGYFKTNTQYFFNYDAIHEGDFQGSFIYVYTDGSNSQCKYISQRDKTVDYIGFTFLTQANGGKTTFSNFILTEGENNSNYELYKENRNDILLSEPLRKDDHLYEDDMKIKVYRESKEYILTGIEDWNQYNDQNNFSCIGFYLQLSKRVDAKLDGKFICSHFKSNDVDVFPGNITIDDELIFVKGRSGEQSPSYIKISILKSKLSTQNVEGFKAWLKDNPIKVIYQLANPVVEIIDSIDINVDTYKDKTYIATDNEIQGELEFKTQNNFGAIMKNVNRCISKIFNSLNNILNIKGE